MWQTMTSICCYLSRKYAVIFPVSFTLCGETDLIKIWQQITAVAVKINSDLGCISMTLVPFVCMFRIICFISWCIRHMYMSWRGNWLFIDFFTWTSVRNNKGINQQLIILEEQLLSQVTKHDKTAENSPDRQIQIPKTQNFILCVNLVIFHCRPLYMSTS